MLRQAYEGLQLQALGPRAVVDILLLALIIYQLLKLVRGTRALNMMAALFVIVVVYLVSAPELMALSAVHTVLGSLFTYVPIALIVLFQSQIRRFLSSVGRNPIARFLPRKRDDRLIDEVALAAASLASKRLGALIVIERDIGLRGYWETGIELDACVTYDLLMNIFTYRSPLHDGAAILAEGRIKAACCYLPLTTNPSLSRSYGTRHRAAFGVSEESDALAVVVSEERGAISLVVGGEITENLDAAGLTALLHRALDRGERRYESPIVGTPRALDA